MKILLLGEYSALHKNLKEGLQILGYKCDLASDGDGFKKINGADIYISSSSNEFIRKLEKLMFPLTSIEELYNYDIVQLINPKVFGLAKFNYNLAMLKKLKKHSGKMFLSSCGTDYYVFSNKDNLRYNPYDEEILFDNVNSNYFTNKWYMENNIEVINFIDGIIPAMYEYADAYRNHNKTLSTIPPPININKIKFVPQIIENNRLKIFHGLNREGFKGTKYIRSAMERLKKNYPNDVDILIDGKMPFEKYLKILEEANVVVDQALSYSYGMNAIYSMAMGKVVLSGNEPECQQEFGRTDIPVINILPSVDDIYNKLEELVLNKQSVIEIGEKSRLFVEDFHHYVKVAQQYVDTWNSVEVNN